MPELRSFPVRKPHFPNILDGIPFEEELLFFENEYCCGLLADVSKIAAVIDHQEAVFLSPAERESLQKMTAPNVRRTRIAGRVCAKVLWQLAGDIKYQGQIDWNSIETLGLEGIPQLFVQGRSVNRTLTISHSDDLVLVLLAKSSGISIGCDLVQENTVAESVQQNFFHDSEKNSNREQVWAVKETAFKAMGQGRPFRPKDWLTTQSNNGDFFCTDLVSEQHPKMTIQTYHYKQHVKKHIVALGQYAAASHPNIPLAVIGFGCRFPQINSPQDYWNCIQTGKSVISEVPPKRLNRQFYVSRENEVRGKCYATLAGVIDSSQFETELESACYDKRLFDDEGHRLAFRVILESFKNAGYDPQRLPSKNIGVYIGYTQGNDREIERVFSFGVESTAAYLNELPEFQKIAPTDRQDIIAQTIKAIQRNYPLRSTLDPAPGDNAGIARNISQSLGLTGPSIVLDAACASSLVALSCAGMALQFDEIDMAVVGGASYLRFDNMIHFAHAKAASNLGSMPFDRRAGGMVAGDGYAFLIVKRLDKALRDGDTIKGIIRGIGVSSDGKGKSLWAPRKEGQVLAIQRAYTHSSLSGPEQLGYIEAHATSTQLGDVTELLALNEVIGNSVPKRIPVGSVKANIGHCLESAGIAGLMKVLLMFENETIPRQINIESLTEKFPWKQSSFWVPQENLPWKNEPDVPRIAAVNAFGIGGLNVHAVVESPSNLNKTVPATGSPKRTPIAIVGMSCILPGAFSLEAYRHLRKTTDDPKTTPPTDRYDLLFSDPPSTMRGGYLTGYHYDWKTHKIPPVQVTHGNPLQFMLLDAVEAAINSAGLRGKIPEITTGAVVGTLFDSDFSNALQMGIRLPEFENECSVQLRAKGIPESEISIILEKYRNRLLERLPALWDDSGSFTCSTLASKITKAYNFGGGAVTLNAGSCSSFAALQHAVSVLRLGDADMMVCVGAQRSVGRLTWESVLENEFPPAEGVIVFLLKRLDDAQRDGNVINAVIDDIVLHREENSAKSVRNAVHRVLETGLIDLQHVRFLEAADSSTVSSTSLSDFSIPIVSPASRLGHLSGASGCLALLDAVIHLEELEEQRDVNSRLCAVITNRGQSNSVYAVALERHLPASPLQTSLESKMVSPADPMLTNPSAVYYHCGNSPEERGGLYGSRLTKQIRRTVDSLLFTPSVSFGKKQDFISQKILQELRAVAEGAGVPLERILQLNFSTVPIQHCFAETDRYQSAHHVSWKTLATPLFPVTQVRRIAKEIPHLFIGLPGQCGGFFGVNQYGFSVSLSAAENSKTIFPGSIIVQQLLAGSKTIEDAKQILQSIPISEPNIPLSFALMESASGISEVWKPEGASQMVPFNRCAGVSDIVLIFQQDRLFFISPADFNVYENIPGFFKHDRISSNELLPLFGLNFETAGHWNISELHLDDHFPLSLFR